jgi:hypothetical protein
MAPSPDLSDATPRSLYDPDPVAEDHLWFLPAAASEPAGSAGPLHRSTGIAAAWHEAQAALALPLARAAGLFGALDERLSRRVGGARHRLAVLEAAEISWLAGERISADRLALWIGLRAGAAGDDAPALARAAWAARRLAGGPGPAGGPVALAAFLDRQEVQHRGEHAPRDDLGGRLEDWSAAIAGGEGLHPFVRSAFGLWAWRMAGLSGAGPAGDLDAMVVASRLAAEAGRGGAPFLPLALAGPQAARPAGSVPERLARWLDAAERSVLAALLHLDRLEAWQARALAATAHLSGRTPPLLIDVLADWPLVSAPLAEEKTGASRAAVQRNLDLLAAQGLLREATGQGRYRMWAARL